MTEDKTFLEDLLAAAVNDAVRKVEAQSQDSIKNMAGGIDLPAGFKMPF
jgi:DNA-binding protein YbaB